MIYKNMLQRLGTFLFKVRFRRPAIKTCRECQTIVKSAGKDLPFCGQPTAHTHPHLLQTGEVTPCLSIDVYRKRRLNLMELISKKTHKFGTKAKGHLVLIPSNTKAFMSENIPYPFRQNTNFLYLSGFKEPESVLLLQSIPEKSLPEHTSILFISKTSSHAERWEGPKTNLNGAVSYIGVDSAFYLDELEKCLQSYASKYSSFMFWYDYLSSPFPRVQEVVRDFIANYNNINFESPRSLIHELRLIKSDPEIKLLEKSCKIASEAMIEVMKFSKISPFESHLQAKMDFECRIRGADYLAFPPVVAGGSRANTIHYISNNSIIENDETVLMDAGCECHGYSSDLTRTWPVCGSFSNPQKELYEVVLEVQEELINLCKQFPSLDHLFQVMCKSMGAKLKKLGIIPASASKSDATKMAYDFCPHHVGHYLGMDVHDTSLISRAINVQPGMVITIEPGIYIRRDDDRVPAKYRGLCVRIEDDVLITEHGPKVLTSHCPKDVNTIENLMS